MGGRAIGQAFRHRSGSNPGEKGAGVAEIRLLSFICLSLSTYLELGVMAAGQYRQSLHLSNGHPGTAIGLER